MKLAELRDLTRQELLQRKRDLEEELFNLRMRTAVKTLENPLKLRTLGRDIARVMTVLREDELAIRSLSQAKTSVLAAADKKKS